MIQNLIWDFDGMLFNSYPHMIEAMRRMLADNGIEQTAEQIFPTIKQSVGYCIRQYFPQTVEDKELYRRLLNEYQHYELKREMEPVAVAFPAIPALIRALCEGGRRNFVYSHRDDSLYAYLQDNGIGGCFVDCITEDQHFPHKPAPDAIMYLLEKHGLDPKTTMMLGDREIDVQSGHNAGVCACLYDEFSFHPKTEAEYCITEIEQLYDILKLPRIG